MHEVWFAWLCISAFCEMAVAREWYEDRSFRLPVREPVEVGYVREIKLQLGESHYLKTLSVNPPLFEVSNFLTSEESSYLIHLAKTLGLQDSPLHPEVLRQETSREVFDAWDTNGNGFLEPLEFTYIRGKGDLYLTQSDVEKMFNDLFIDKNGDNRIDFNEFRTVRAATIGDYFQSLLEKVPRLRSRNSRQAWLWHYGAYDELLEGFHERIARLTLLPHELIEMSEPLQVVNYEQGGHYHCHHDSDDVNMSIPCCTYSSSDHTECRLCRYATVLFFLSNVTGGGETAFPMADNDTFSWESWVDWEPKKCNLITGCYKSNLVFKPVQGTALFWYNHHVDEKTGWLGALDPLTFHGGCEVTNGEKWIANAWINVIGKKGSEESYKGWLETTVSELKVEL